MTARTHDLFAATALVGAAVFTPLPPLTLGTALTAIAAGFLGGMAPDLDEPGAQFWRRLPAGAGSIIGRIVAPVFGSHRFVSHSLLGLVILGWLAQKLLALTSSFLVVDATVVWWSFMLGSASHLAADALTREGIPLLFPLPIKFGFPPFKSLRLATGSWLEKGIVFPGLVLLNIHFIYAHYPKFLSLVRSLV